MNKSADAFRTISEVADWLGVQTHVLRFWESKFTQVKPVKRAGGRRYYRPSDMLLLGGIRKLLHDDGLTIKGVQKILREEGMAHVADMSRPLDEETDAHLDSDLAARIGEDVEMPQAPVPRPTPSPVTVLNEEPAPGAPVDDAAPAPVMPSFSEPLAPEPLETKSATPEPTPTPAPDLPPSFVRRDFAETEADGADPATPFQDFNASDAVEPASLDDSSAPDPVDVAPTERGEPVPLAPLPDAAAPPDPAPEAFSADLPTEDATRAPVDEATPVADPVSSTETSALAEPGPIPDTAPIDAGPVEEQAEAPAETAEPASAALPSFLSQPAAAEPAAPKPRIVDVPDDPDPASFTVAPSSLTKVGQITRLTPEQASALRPLLAQLTALRDQMSGARRDPR